MSPYFRKKMIFCERLLVVFAGMFLVMQAQRTTSYLSLIIMFIGIAGIVLTLLQYNSGFNSGRNIAPVLRVVAILLCVALFVISFIPEVSMVITLYVISVGGIVGTVLDFFAAKAIAKAE